MWFEQFELSDQVVASDASLVGAGGTWAIGKQFYRCEFPAEIKEGSSICHLELWALIISLKLGSAELQGKAVVVHCDNQAVAELINSGRARDERLQCRLREVCYIAAVAEFEILAQFIPGVTNRLPDFLSRWTLGESYRRQFRMEAPGFTCRTVRQSLFNYSHDW